MRSALSSVALRYLYGYWVKEKKNLVRISQIGHSFDVRKNHKLFNYVQQTKLQKHQVKICGFAQVFKVTGK